jgi:hypothetical protein
MPSLQDQNEGQHSASQSASRGSIDKLLSQRTHWSERHGTIGASARYVHTFSSESKRLCAKVSGGVLSQTPQHDAHHRNVDPSLFTAGKDFVVLGEATPSGEPGERSLDSPSPLEHVEATRTDLLPIHLHSFRHPHTADAVTFDAPRSRPLSRGWL